MPNTTLPDETAEVSAVSEPEASPVSIVSEKFTLKCPKFTRENFTFFGRKRKRAKEKTKNSRAGSPCLAMKPWA
jgi:hypothetical protein